MFTLTRILPEPVGAGYKRAGERVATQQMNHTYPLKRTFTITFSEYADDDDELDKKPRSSTRVTRTYYKRQRTLRSSRLGGDRPKIRLPTELWLLVAAYAAACWTGPDSSQPGSTSRWTGPDMAALLSLRQLKLIPASYQIKSSDRFATCWSFATLMRWQRLGFLSVRAILPHFYHLPLLGCEYHYCTHCGFCLFFYALHNGRVLKRFAICSSCNPIYANNLWYPPWFDLELTD